MHDFLLHESSAFIVSQSHLATASDPSKCLCKWWRKGATGTKEDPGSARGAVTRSVPAVTGLEQAKTVLKS
jgi:hypothetical protein